jgi:hypothetical protein
MIVIVIVVIQAIPAASAIKYRVIVLPAGAQNGSFITALTGQGGNQRA